MVRKNILFNTRFVCIANYPVDNSQQGIPHYQKGDIIDAVVIDDPDSRQPTNGMCWDQETDKFFSQYHDLFRRLKWYEHRTIDEIITLRFIEITAESQGYYVPGDKIKVTHFEFAHITTIAPIIRYVCAEGRKYELDKVLPAKEAKLLSTNVNYNK